MGGMGCDIWEKGYQSLENVYGSPLTISGAQ